MTLLKTNIRSLGQVVCGCICGTTIDSAWPNHLATVLAAHFDFNGGVYQLERRIQPRKIQIFPVSLLCRVRCFAFSKGLLYMIVENSTTFLIFCHAPVPIPTIPRSCVSHAPFMLDIPSFQLVSLPAIPIFYPPSHRLCSSVASVSARSSHLYACAFRYISSSHFPRFAVITIFTHKSKMCKNVYIILYVYIYIYPSPICPPPSRFAVGHQAPIFPKATLRHHLHHALRPPTAREVKREAQRAQRCSWADGDPVILPSGKLT